MVSAMPFSDDASLDDMTHFLEEALRMRSFSHEHVLTMLGIVDFDERPYVVLPYMANGDLKGYLLDHKQVRVTPSKIAEEFLLILIANILDQFDRDFFYLYI